MEREQELAIIRRAYAKQVMAEWQVDDRALSWRSLKCAVKISWVPDRG